MIDHLFLRSWRPYAWLALAIVALFGPTVFCDYVVLDDDKLIRENMPFLSDPANVLKAFSAHYFQPESIYGYYYRPLVTVSFMLDAWMSGGNVWAFHATNVALHIVATWFVFVLLKKTARHSLALFPFLFALLFAVHPVQAMAVAWIPGRNDLLFAVFALFSVVSYMRHERTGGTGAHLAHLAAFVLALLTKEAAVCIPAICALWTFLNGDERATGGSTLARIKRTWTALPILEWMSIGFVWVVIRGMALGMTAFFGPPLFSMKTAPVTVALLARYLGKTVMPFNCALIPTFSGSTVLYGNLALAALLAMGCWQGKRTGRYFLFGAGWFLLFLAPAMPFSTQGDIENLGLLEHRLYMPLVGILATLMAGWGHGAEASYAHRLRRVRYSAMAMLVVAAGLAGITARRIPAFVDGYSFWTTAVRESPHSHLANMSLGVIYLRRHEPDRAKPLFDKVVTRDPKIRYGHHNLGAYYLDKGQLDFAEAEYKKEIEFYPESLPSYQCLALVYQKMGKNGEAHNILIRAKQMEKLFKGKLRELSNQWSEQQR